MHTVIKKCPAHRPDSHGTRTILAQGIMLPGLSHVPVAPHGNADFRNGSPQFVPLVTEYHGQFQSFIIYTTNFTHLIVAGSPG